jgi:hypothetical protein
MTFPYPRHAIVAATLWLACTGAFSLLPAQEEANPLALSSRRVALLRQLVHDYMTGDGAKETDERAAREILRRFARREPYCPTGAIDAEVQGDNEVLAAVEKTVESLVAKKYPGLDMKKLETEAQARYPIYKKGDFVEFFYATNPQIVRKVRGIYHGRNVRLVQIGSSAIQLEDIARVKGNDELLLRFDPEASKALRKTFIEEKQAAYKEEKEEYERKVRAYTWNKEYARMQQANQAEGFLFVGNEWTTAAQLVKRLITDERERLAQKDREERERRLQEKRRRLAVAADRQAEHAATIDHAMYANVDAEYAAFKERMAAAAELATKPPEPVEPAPEPVEVSSEPTPEPTPEPEPTAPEPIAEEPAKPLFLQPWALAAAGGLLVAIVVVAIVVIRRRSGGPGRELRKFFQGRGKVQRTFWQMAEENPATFKYVAYRYNTGEEARQALLQLSYVNERVGGDLVCRHEVYFGYGPHQDKFVAFVGGNNLHYALWREASAVFPEYPGAEYFRVSTAPDVHLEIPNLESLLADPELQIEHVENREGEGTDYSQYYIYKAPHKENALEFLKHAMVQEAGLHVIVLTTEGVFGKDENGIYEESMDVWTERYPEHFDQY